MSGWIIARRPIGCAIAVSGGLAAAIFGASPAWAAATLGQTAAVLPTTCGATTTFIQSAVAGAPSYTVPAGGGVITRWSTMANGNPDRTMALKLVRQVGAGTTFIAVGGDAERTLTPSVLNSFDVRIPVQGGEMLSVYYSRVSTGCVFVTTAGDSARFVSGSHPEPGLGETLLTDAQSTGFRVNVAASLEPDADGDGYGDESQDLCPSNGKTALACPTTSTTPMSADTAAPRGTAIVTASKLRAALARGLTAIIGISEPGRVSASASARLPSGGAAAAVVARGSGRASHAGAVRVMVRFTETAKKRLRAARRVKLTLRFTLSDSAGNRAKPITKRLTLRRR